MLSRLERLLTVDLTEPDKISKDLSIHPVLVKYTKRITQCFRCHDFIRLAMRFSLLLLLLLLLFYM